jgi:hypothetical protein
MFNLVDADAGDEFEVVDEDTARRTIGHETKTPGLVL